VATGRIERGRVKVGEEVAIIGFESNHLTTVTGVEMFRKSMEEGQAGDNVGCLLRGIDKEGIERGQVLAKPGSIKPHKKFMGEVYVLKKEEGVAEVGKPAIGALARQVRCDGRGHRADRSLDGGGPNGVERRWPGSAARRAKGNNNRNKEATSHLTPPSGEEGIRRRPRRPIEAQAGGSSTGRTASG
jgi:hypothetical protein